nr:uncharacterized protein LOC124806310 [Hydra vulgaris]
MFYTTQVQQMQRREISNKNCGIKWLSCLTELPYYHSDSNDSADIMHDIFEGVILCEVKLFLYHVLYDVKYMSIAELNRCIKFMDYGIVCSSKPSTINESRMKSTDSLLGQHSAHMLTMFIYLPLILSGVIDKVDTQKWKLYQILKHLCDEQSTDYVQNDCSQTDFTIANNHVSLNQTSSDVRKLLDKHQTGKLVIVEYETTGIKLHKKKITPHGHIEEWLKTIRKFDGVHAQAIRKQKPISLTTFDVAVPFSNEERNIISELSFDDIQYDRKPFILEKTRVSRRNWIKSSKPPFHEFIRKFPSLKDLGFDFQREFTATFENAQDLLMQWEDIAPHFITWARRKANPMVKQLLLELDSQLIHSNDRNMEFAFHLLPYILQVPPRNKDRPSTAEVAAHFIRIFPDTTPMETIIGANRHTSFMHPFVITLGARGSLIQSFIFIEDNVVSIRNGMLSAVDRLLKLYFVIDIEYVLECRHVLHFLQRVVMGINDDLPLS